MSVFTLVYLSAILCAPEKPVDLPRVRAITADPMRNTALITGDFADGSYGIGHFASSFEWVQTALPAAPLLVAGSSGAGICWSYPSENPFRFYIACPPDVAPTQFDLPQKPDTWPRILYFDAENRRALTDEYAGKRKVRYLLLDLTENKPIASVIRETKRGTSIAFHAQMLSSSSKFHYVICEASGLRKGIWLTLLNFETQTVQDSVVLTARPPWMDRTENDGEIVTRHQSRGEFPVVQRWSTTGGTLKMIEEKKFESLPVNHEYSAIFGDQVLFTLEEQPNVWKRTAEGGEVLAQWCNAGERKGFVQLRERLLMWCGASLDVLDPNSGEMASVPVAWQPSEP